MQVLKRSVKFNAIKNIPAINEVNCNPNIFLSLFVKYNKKLKYKSGEHIPPISKIYCQNHAVALSVKKTTPNKPRLHALIEADVSNHAKFNFDFLLPKKTNRPKNKLTQAVIKADI